MIVPVLDAELVMDAVFGLGKLVEVPSTWICPAVALVGIAMVCPEEVSGVAPGVNVIEPATKLVGLPTNVIPSSVYVDKAAAELLVLVLAGLLVDPPGPCAVFGGGNAVVLPSTWICPPVALVGIPTVWPAVVTGGPPGVRVTLPATKLVGLPTKVIPSIV